MLFLNRLTSQTTEEIPDQSIVGQWQILTQSDRIFLNNVELSNNSQEYLIHNATNYCLLTNNKTNLNIKQHFPSWQIPSDILSDSLRFFASEIEKLSISSALWEDLVKISPLIPEIEEKINIQPLEITISKHFGHLEQVCRRPRSYLQLEIEKLPVSRTQRIPPNAIEFLASHTEDWEKRTFRSIVPKRVLCMVRDELWDIYENQVVVRLIDHLLLYINRRIQQVNILKKQLEEVEYLSGITNDIYWRNINRICMLWGNQFDTGTVIKVKIKAMETLVKLQQLQQKLRSLLDTDLYKAISKRTTIGRTLKQTNILINDQHYRYVDLLWREWSRNQSNKIKTTRQVFVENQQLFHGFESFSFLLLAIALTGSSYNNDHGFGFKISTEIIPYPKCKPIQFLGPLGEVSVTWEADGSFLIQSKGINNLRLIPILATLSATNNYNSIASTLQVLSSTEQSNDENISCILYPGTEEEMKKLPDDLQQQINFITPKSNLTILPISPLDIFSIERLGRMIQGWLNGQRYLSYPPNLLSKIPDTLATNIQCLQKISPNQFHVLRQFSQQEAEQFRNNIDQQIANIKPRRKNKVSIQELQQLQDLPRHCKELIDPLQVCPVCYSTGVLKPLDSQSFSCNCTNCNSYWGIRICGSCSQKYPFIQLQRMEEYILPNISIDRTFGRDILALPFCSNKDISSFVCPNCHKCG